MSWTQVVESIDAKIAEECRAGILLGSRLPISDDPDAALAVQRWAAPQKPAELESRIAAELFPTIYDSSDDPPRLTPDLLAAGDDRLSTASLVPDARIFVLRHDD
jgi:hypothetical protein